MKRRAWFLIGVIALLAAGLGPALTVSGQDSASGDLLRLLTFVPDTPASRRWVSFGDEAAWLESWDVPRVDNVAQLDGLDRDPRAYWMFIMPTQTTPPEVLGLNYLLSEDQRSYYGFDLFNVDRYLEAGMVPETISVIEYSFNGQRIADALTATGYEAQTLESGGTLFSILQDNQVALGQNVALPRVGMLGRLNRIVVLDGQIVVGRATALVEDSLQAQQEMLPSLADDPVYAAAVQALDAEDLSDTGALMGVIMTQYDAAADPVALVLGGDASDLETATLLTDLRDQFGTEPLPPYSLAVFATRHTPGATSLILEVVFPAGTDASAAADVLANRLQNYTSLATQRPLSERWTFDRAASAEIDGLPVALVVMRIDDPPVAEAGEPANTGVLNWITLISRRDLGFLVAGSLGQ